MDVSVGKPWDDMVNTLVRDGRYASATEVVEKGLRLVEHRERELQKLRARLQEAGRSDFYTDEELNAYLSEEVAWLDALGFFDEDVSAFDHAGKRTGDLG